MPVIRTLPPSLVNKIAAGEVIERPASVVKELLENSLDAGATRVDIAIEQGGSELIRIVDDGCGIAADELPLAIASHATSKLATADDLFRIMTLGFRGEALASIAEVSRLRLRSRRAEDSEAAELEVVGGESTPVAPCGGPVGTLIEVRNLFFNVPVRRKFLKTTQTESGHVTEVVTRVALANPRLHITLRHNDRLVYDLPADNDILPRIAAFFGQELADNLIDVESRDGGARVWGYVADPTHSRANNRMQYLFLNGRPIRDRSLQHALGEGYRGLLLTGRFPIAFLHLELPPEEVDVNVHPTKLEVRFADGGRLYSQLLATIRNRFLTTDLTARGTTHVAARGAGMLPNTGIATNPASAEAMLDLSRRRAEVVAWARGELADAATRVGQSVEGLLPGSDNELLPDFAASGTDDGFNSGGRLSAWDAFRNRARGPLEFHTLDRPEPEPTTNAQSTVNQENDDEEPEPEGLSEALAELDRQFAAAHPDGSPTMQPSTNTNPNWRFDARPQALQIHNRYLVAESAEGVVVIDQHALHERILYEQLRTRVLGGTLESQALLVPEPVDLAPADAAAVLDHANDLAKLGLRVEAFGGGTILIQSYPALLSRMAPAEILRAVADQLATGKLAPDGRDLVDSLLHTFACKAAIKAGDPLTPDEIEALLAQRHLAQDAHHCPHGRPTSLVFTREDLDRQFRRT